MLNNNYKLLSCIIYISCPKKSMCQIISETQSGFLNDRSIHNNIRLLLDILDYNEITQDKGFKKAFDTVEHSFMIHTLSQPYETLPCFDVQKGIRQGCLAGPRLFILAAECYKTN